jgi:hypothetical protein
VPTRRRAAGPLALAAAVLVAAAGCGGGSGGTHPHGAKTTGPVVYPGSSGNPGNKEFDARRLRAATLGPADLPGYERGDHAYDLRGGCLEQVIGFLYGDLGDVTAQTETSLVNASTAGAVQQRMRAYKGDAAAQHFEQAAKAAPGCATLIGRAKDGARTEFTVKPLVMPKYGEQMLSLRIVGVSPNVAGQEVNLVIVRVENVVEKLDDMNTRGVSVDHTTQLTQTAVTKLRTAA